MSNKTPSFVQKSFVLLVIAGLLLSNLGSGVGVQTVHALEDARMPSNGGCSSQTPGKSDQCEQDSGLRAQSVQSVPGAPLSFLVNDNTSTAMYYNGLQQFYGENAEGVFIWVNGAVYGPGLVPAGLSTHAYTPISNFLSGTGASNDPWKITTVVDVGASGLHLQQDVKYVNGESNVTYTWKVSNNSGSPISYTLFHAADIYTNNNDYGYGYHNPSTGAIGGYTQGHSFYQYFQPTTPGSKYFEGTYLDTWTRIGSTSGLGVGFNNTYLPNDYIDNGIGLQWNRTVAANATDTISDHSVFNTEIGGITCRTLTISAASGGSVQALTPSSSDCPSGQYLDGTTVWLKATPSGQNELSSWVGVDYVTKANYASVDMNSDKTVTATFRKPVIVLVHGILTAGTWADSCQSAAYHYSANPSSANQTETNLRQYFKDLPGTLNANYDVWIAHIASAPIIGALSAAGTPSLEVNAKCLADQIKDIDNTLQHPRSLRLIAHSMGGPISRACISQNLQGCRDLVDSLMTLGSPHAGTEFLAAQTALQEMTDSRMGDFNNMNPNRWSVNFNKYVFLGGDWWNNESDVAVPKASSVGWSDIQGNTNPPYWDTGWCNPANASCRVQPSRLWTDNNHTNYFDSNSNSHAMSCITWYLQGGSQPAVCETAQSSAPGSDIVQTTPRVENSLAPAASADYAVQIDTPGNTSFVLKSSGGNPAFTLTQPGGQIIDPAYAAANPAVVTYSDLPGAGLTFSQRIYTFVNAPAGAWQLHVNNTGADSSYVYSFARFSSARTLTVLPSADTIAPGDLLTVTATLNNVTTGITGTTVSGALTRSDGVSDALAFTDQGNGVYTASYNAPNVPGYLTMTVTATGTDDLTPFERQAIQMLGISAPVATFNNTYSGAAVDQDGNGKYEAIEAQVGVNVTSGGDFLLSGDLTSNGQYVTHAGAQATLANGGQTITLSFSGDDLRASGLDGPYTLTNLRLVKIPLGSIPVALAADVWTTDAYNAVDFAATCFDLHLASSQAIGGTLVANPTPNCGGTQYAAGSLVSVTAVADTGYSFTQWRGDASGTSNPVNLTMSNDRLLLADFAPLCYTLTLASNPPAVGSLVRDVFPDCNGNTQYSYGTVVRLTATGNSTNDFSHWSGSLSGSVNPVLLTMNANKSVTANYIAADHIPPTVNSSLRADPEPTEADVVHFTVTFSEAVTGVDINDFAIIASNITDATITSVSSGTTTYTVTVNTGTGSGYIRLDVVDNDSILDMAGNKLGGTGLGNGGFNNGDFYTVRVDATPPTVISILRANLDPTAAAHVDFTVTFSEAVTNVDAADFSLVVTNITGASVGSVSGSGAIYTVRINTGSGNGTLHLDVPASASISDLAGNPLGGLPYIDGQTYNVNKTLTFTSGINDGWVLETSETSGKGGSRDSSATTFNLGDDKNKRQYIVILSFSTGASLPDNAVITGIKLKLKKSGVVGGGNPLGTFRGFMIDIKKGFFDIAPTLQSGDFQAKAGHSYGPFLPALANNWYSINLIDAKGYINKLPAGSGLTQMRLRFKLDDNNNGIANYLRLYSGNAPAVSRPQLVITYYVPVP